MFCPQWCLDIRQYLRSSEQDLKKTLLREKLCSSLLLISFLSCASAEKEIKLLPVRSNVKPRPLQCQDCYLCQKPSCGLHLWINRRRLQTYSSLPWESSCHHLKWSKDPGNCDHLEVWWSNHTQMCRSKTKGLAFKDAHLLPRRALHKAVPAADNRLRQIPVPKVLWMFLLRIFKGMLRMFLKAHIAIQNRDKYNRKNLL